MPRGCCLEWRTLTQIAAAAKGCEIDEVNLTSVLAQKGAPSFLTNFNPRDDSVCLARKSSTVSTTQLQVGMDIQLIHMVMRSEHVTK
jgi:hypothetical protein